jgi:hypothetical protein
MENDMTKTNYNIMALRGASIDDMEYVDTFGLDPELAYTPALNDEMLKITFQQNIDEGMDEAEAIKIRDTHAQGIQRLLAANGMLKSKN